MRGWYIIQKQVESVPPAKNRLAHVSAKSASSGPAKVKQLSAFVGK